MGLARHCQCLGSRMPRFSYTGNEFTQQAVMLNHAFLNSFIYSYIVIGYFIFFFLLNWLNQLKANAFSLRARQNLHLPD